MHLGEMLRKEYFVWMSRSLSFRVACVCLSLVLRFGALGTFVGTDSRRRLLWHALPCAVMNHACCRRVSCVSCRSVLRHSGGALCYCH